MTESNNEAPRILVQLAQRLHEIFDGHIDLNDVAEKPANHQEAYFITRAYMALYFLNELGLTPDQAASCITDGGADDGVDAVYIDKNAARIYFGQSKWRKNMSKGVELTDFVRFRDGVKSAIMGQWTAENANLHRFKSDIEQQLTNIDTEVVLVLAHTSEHEIAKNIQAKIDQFIIDENKFNEFMSFDEFRVAEAAKTARSYTRPEKIDVPVLLAHWGLITAPYRAVYGTVAASDVVGWFEKYGNRLFAENLRFGIEKSEVNDGIMATAQAEPDNFWYYNNGITAICTRFDKQPLGGPDTGSGVFDVTRISVINGAQTITSLARAKNSGSDLTRVKIHLRVISLDETADDFSEKVTSANNTQNDLNPVDFVAADPNQDRLRKEAAALGLVYAYRRGDKDPDRAKGFNIRQATVSAACASGDLKLAVAAKRYISGLWENPKKDPYTRLFNANTTATRLSRIVQIMHAVDDALLEEGKELTGRERLTSVHANRFILFVVYEILGNSRIDSEEKIESLKSEAIDLTKALLAEINTQISSLYPDAYPGNIFKNNEKQAELFTALSA